MSDTKHKKWSNIDETNLLQLISKNKSIDKISTTLQKKEKDIIYKLKKIALNMYNEKKSKDEIKKSLKLLTDKQINKISEHVNNKKLQKITNIIRNDELTELGMNKKKTTIY